MFLQAVEDQKEKEESGHSRNVETIVNRRYVHTRQLLLSVYS